MTQTNTPKPQTPWAVTIQQRLSTAGLITLGALLAGVAVKTTGLSGKLGFAAAFFFISTVLIFIQQLRLRDLAAAKDSLLSSLASLAIVLTLIPILSIVATVVSKGYKGIHFGMFTNDMTMASVNDPVNAGGLLHALVGTILMVGGALLFSFPIGLLTALYLTEIKGPGSKFIQFTVQAMSGVPSVVAGLFIFAAIILATPLKASGIDGAFALSILMVPTVTRTAQEVLLLVPNDLREAGLAMGATQWKTVALVVVPAARSGLITATILGVARIAGETAPLLFTVGVFDSCNFNPFKGDQGSIPTVVWAGLLGGTPESIQRAWSAILVLLIVVLIMFVLARAFGAKSPKK